ncbi:putative phage tail sheath protein [Thioploca ingrica]|uniref:Putative phage tail sheath protein n=1 Tax=Thioploca ingrica TaxID=40754 RepID=A0A090AMB4_9GAMM|nr:putative phage tail sheath protein [Thioploca ingrica]
MATPTYPGVYVEEVSSGVRPLTLASTSTAAFIGPAEKGATDKAVKVYNFSEYQNLYGGFVDYSFLTHAVYQFFNNGGSQCYIVNVPVTGLKTAEVTLDTNLKISAISPGAWGNNLKVTITQLAAVSPATTPTQFNLAVYLGANPAPVETFEDLNMTAADPNFVATVINGHSKYITVAVEPATTTLPTAVSKPFGKKAEVSLGSNLDIFAISPGLWGNHLQVTIAPTTSTQFDLKVYLDPDLTTPVPVETFKDLSMTATDPKFVETVINGHSKYITVKALTADLPTATTTLLSNGEGDGSDGTVAKPDYTNAFQLLNDKDDVSLIATPGRDDVIGDGMNYCANRSLSDCFFIGDLRQADDSVETAKTAVGLITPKNSYGAVYLPWLYMTDPTGRSPEPILVPPSGYIAGLYAKTDTQRGVWKAPAGTAAALAGTVGLKTNFTDVQQGNLNPKNINCIRQFSASGIVIWGARTISSDPEWRYIPVRRMSILLRVSIYNGIQWAVFEPNDEELWSQLRLNINAFMMTLYRRGAFQGSSPSQAFFVKCDGETTPQADIDQGIVNVLVGFAPLKPAEFVMVKISQKAGQTA